MRVLLDEQLPRRLAHEFPEHDIRTVQQEGWSGVKNGELLRRASASGLDVFMTADQGIQFQQNLTLVSLRIVVLLARSNALMDLIPLAPQIRLAIPTLQPGQILRIGN